MACRGVFFAVTVDIVITLDKGSGNAIIHLDAQREFRILFWRVRRSVTFHRETAIDPMRQEL